MATDTDRQANSQAGTVWTGLKTALFTVLGPGTVAGLIPQRLARQDQNSLQSDSLVARIVGGASLTVGVLLYLHTAWRFTNEGKGTPSPTDEPKKLVTGGMYAYVRNPMYVAVLLCIAGQALLYSSKRTLAYAGVFWLISNTWITAYEEPHLASKHGEVYEQYCERVPRWIPRLRSSDER